MTAKILRYAAFTVNGGGGNPAGVVLDARGLADDEMLAIAAELGYSETAFVTEPLDDAGRARVRYFAPLREVPFCGHATVASAVALAERGAPADLVFATAAGPVEIHTEQSADGFSAELTSVPPTVAEADPAVVAEALEALRWAADDLDPGYPTAIADAGARHLVLVARTRARLADLDYDFERLAGLMRATRPDHRAADLAGIARPLSLPQSVRRQRRRGGPRHRSRCGRLRRLSPAPRQDRRRR